jgi:hypothetical protein
MPMFTLPWGRRFYRRTNVRVQSLKGEILSTPLSKKEASNACA